MSVTLFGKKGSVCVIKLRTWRWENLGLHNSVQSVQSVMSDSLQPHGLQHARLPCPSLTPGVYSNSCPLSLWCHPTISSSVVPFSLPPSVFPSIRVFSNESALHIRRPKYWSFSFNISPSNEYPGPISFRMDWLDLLQVQGTINSLLQHHSSKASILWHSAFIVIQQSHPYMTTGKTIALTRWTFVHSWALNSVTGAVIKERRDSNTNTEAEATWRWKQSLDSHQQRKRLRIFISFRASGGRTTLVTPTLR